MKNVILVFAVVCCMIAVNSVKANDTWTGGGADNNWSTDANWLSGTAPGTSYGSKLYWNDDGLGSESVMDQDYLVRYLIFTNSSSTAQHVLNLDGNKLEVFGYIWDGYKTTDSLLTITNGTLQLGRHGYYTGLYVGYEGSSFNGAYTGHSVVVSADFNAVELGDIYVGYHKGTYWYPSHVSGSLDMSSCNISSDGIANKLKCVNLVIGAALNYTYGIGILKLPAAITEIESDEFVVGGNGIGGGSGLLDLGVGSQLTNIIAKTKFWLGAGSLGVISNFPSSVNLHIGTSSTPASFRIGAGQNKNNTTAIGGSLITSNATVDCYLSELYVGAILKYDSSAHTITGVLDIAQSQLSCGGELNALKTDDLRIGGFYIMPDYYQGGQSIGTLRLPSDVTKIETGIFQLGASRGGYGTLDLGTNSQLNTFTVTNDFYYGTEGSTARLTGIPTNGVNFTVGQSGSHVNMYIGWGVSTSDGYPGYADLVLTNANVSAYLKNLKIGSSDYSGSASWHKDGKLDLSESQLGIMDVSGDVFIGRGNDACPVKNGTGRLYLSGGAMNVASNLYLGDNITGKHGILVLNGTKAVVDGIVDIRQSGVVTTIVSGVSCGLDITTDSESALSVSNGATINISFESIPGNITHDDYWGIRIAGSHINFLQSLIDDGKIVLDLSSLSASDQDRIAIRYSDIDDKTYIGVGRSHGTVITIR